MKTLKEVSDMVGMSRRVIQEYEKAGLAQAPETRNKYGYLLYDQAHIERLWQIRFYRELGYDKRQIGEILNDPQYDSHKAMQQKIRSFRHRKLEIENLIAMAEAADETGISPASIRLGIPGLQNAPYDCVVPVVSRCFQIIKTRIPELCDVLQPIAREEIDRLLELLFSILDGMEEGLPPEGPEIQLRVDQLCAALSFRICSSISVLSCLNLLLSPESHLAAELDRALWPQASAYLNTAIRYYCCAHEKNPTDIRFLNAINQIIRLKKQGFSSFSPSVRSQAEIICRFFSQVYLLKPAGRKLLLEAIQELLLSDTCRELCVSLGEAEDTACFLACAIHNCGYSESDQMEE